MSLLTELKRRNVIRMAGLYLVGAWLITQVSSTVLPMFGAPDWLPRTVVILLAIGFAPAMVFSWIYELTPEGLKRESEIERHESITPHTGRRIDRMIIAVLVLALTYFAFDKLVLGPRREAELIAATTQAVTKNAAPTADAHSIAVLPFVNMSGDAANEYFSDGISEEILNVLARTADLQVAARTSSFSFKGKNEEVPEIARQLQVRMVLEGSVRKQDDRVRITAQLIDAKKGFHVWSQTYDRKLSDIFAIQDEIAQAIGNELQVQIVGASEAGKPSAGTRDVEAYDLYLRGIALWQTREENALWQAIDLFDRSTKSDPKFAQGYAGQALVYGVIGDYSARITYLEAFTRATDFAERALVLDPSLPEPYAVLAMVAAQELRRDTADALLSRSIELRPSFATAHQWRGSMLARSGDLSGGLASLERATTLDPRSLIVAENHALVLRALGRNADARSRCLRALEINPNYAGCLEDVALIDLESHNLEAARPTLDRLAASANPSAAAQGAELVEALAGRRDRKALAQRFAAFAPTSDLDPTSGNALTGYDIPSVLMLLGEPELALGYLERNAEQPGSFGGFAVFFPALDPIRCDPRIVAVVDRLKVKDPHAEQVCGGKR
jgi:TolB-like protein/Tfp pilus assembly protein PilF